MIRRALLLALLTFGSDGANALVASGSVQEAWARNYTSGNSPSFDFAYDVAVDPAGNVYVTGGSYGSNGLYDYATVKYDGSGAMLWAARYNGPDDNWDIAKAVVVDSAGNVYVTGESYGADLFDYVTIKYNSAGIEEWEARYNNGPGSNDDRALALAIDSSGNVYVTGQSSGSGSFIDYATVKYNSSGEQQWVARYNGPGNTRDLAHDVAIDGSGNVYVTGASGEGSPNLSDYVTVKYNAAGAQQWAARYSNAYDYATAVAVDASGNAYVTGYSYGSGTFYDYATVKYNTKGRQQWVARYHGGVGDDFAYALAVDSSRNVYVTGESVGPGSGGDYSTIKYDPRGRQRWVARYNGPGNATDRANAVAVDGAGNVYVTGESEGSGGTVADYATLKYSTLGSSEWLVRYNGPTNTFDLAAALAVDATGSVYVTGRSAQTGASAYATVKYVQTPAQEQEAGGVRPR